MCSNIRLTTYCLCTVPTTGQLIAGISTQWLYKRVHTSICTYVPPDECADWCSYGNQYVEHIPIMLHIQLSHRQHHTINCGHCLHGVLLPGISSYRTTVCLQKLNRCCSQFPHFNVCTNATPYVHNVAGKLLHAFIRLLALNFTPHSMLGNLYSSVDLSVEQKGS